MIIAINDVAYFRNRHLPDDSEYTSEVIGQFVGIEGAIFYIYSSEEAGQYWIDIKVAGQWRNLDTGRVAADDLHIVDTRFFIPEVRVRFKADAPTTLSVHAYGYPAVYTRPVP